MGGSPATSQEIVRGQVVIDGDGGLLASWLAYASKSWRDSSSRERLVMERKKDFGRRETT